MLETIAAYIDRHQLLPASGEVIVAVSGGADSLCLLHLMQRLCGSGKRYPGVLLRAAHLNHQLRGAASEEDAEAVARTCAAWDIPCAVGKSDVQALARERHHSLEEAARIARYRFLREIARGQPIAVAHHADDQVETLVLHWLRGSGLGGLVGMPPRQGDIIRPLLGVTHAQTVEYCRQHAIVPLADLSNADPRFLRNRVRHQALPMLESLNPGIRNTLLRGAETLRADLDFIESQVEERWPQVVTSERETAITLRIPALLSLPLSLQHHLLRRVTARLCGGQSPLEMRHYTLIENLFHLAADRQARALHLPQGLRLTRILHEATVERPQSFVGADLSGTPPIHRPAASAPANVLNTTIASTPPGTVNEVMLPIPGAVNIPGTPWMAKADIITGTLLDRVKAALQLEDWTEVWHLLPAGRYVVYIDSKSIGHSLHIRARRPGDRMQPLGMAHEKKIQDIMVDAHIPRAERGRIPLFFSVSRCLWLAGICIDERARLKSATGQIVRLSLVPVSETEAGANTNS